MSLELSTFDDDVDDDLDPDFLLLACLHSSFLLLSWINLLLLFLFPFLVC